MQQLRYDWNTADTEYTLNLVGGVGLKFPDLKVMWNKYMHTYPDSKIAWIALIPAHFLTPGRGHGFWEHNRFRKQSLNRITIVATFMYWI